MLRRRTWRATTLAWLVVGTLVVAACGAPGSVGGSHRPEAAAGDSSAPAGGTATLHPTTTATTPDGASLVVTGRGSAACPTPPYGCLVGFLVGPADLPVPATWEPSPVDPSFDHTMTGSGSERVSGSPVSVVSTIGFGRHTLVGSVSAVSDVVGGPGSSGPSMLFTYTCQTDLDVATATVAVQVDVRFTNSDDPPCTITVTQR